MNEIFDEMNRLIFFYRLCASNCKGFKNTNLVISSKLLNFRVKSEVLFILVNTVIRRMACELLLMQSV